MAILTIEKIKDEQLKKKAAQAAAEITSCLTGAKNEVKSIFAAYLLYQAASSENPDLFDYQANDSCDFRHGAHFRPAVKREISESEWENLSLLIKKYEPDVFALAALQGFTPSNRAPEMEATPRSISSLALQILQIKKGDSVGDLCCGCGSFLIEGVLNTPKAFHIGCEINPEYQLIASIRASLIDDDACVLLQDVFSLPDDPMTRDFDEIFSNYPFKVSLSNLPGGERLIERLSSRFDGVPGIVSSDWIYNLLLLELLNDEGKAVGIMTNGSAWSGVDKPIRQYFVENGWIESVIALPGKMFTSTPISTMMIVLSKGNNHVQIVDATKLCQQGRRYNEFSAENIAEILEALRSDTPNSKAISVDELRENGYALSPDRYLTKEIVFEHAAPFESVIKSVRRGAPCTAQQLDEMASDSVTNMQYLMLANIQDGLIDERLPYLTAIDEKYERYCLKDNDLILSKNGLPFKAAVARVKDGQKVLASGNLYIIELDREKVNPYYLKAFIESEKGLAVLNSIAIGSVIPSVGVEKLRKVLIPIPPMEEQNRVAEKYQIILDEIAVYKIKLEKALNRLHQVYDEESEGWLC